MKEKGWRKRDGGKGNEMREVGGFIVTQESQTAGLDALSENVSAWHTFVDQS